ncbi:MULTISPECIES: carboxymuconolactone decarboxylase family protein [Rhodophyticola]|jgi:4-carboxymuconolactone decarboxylase|uniref:carboxymuconolactone decarboxylase family protein n=1 Tax=Rhodophyticola TaxID=2680018 RepID=UPI001B28F7AE|nr:carboxymuconolactone decarboxylase family protein [Roseicyclus sp.]MBO6625162.1 carboxymuconolactone decarboxylase family protein [Roseicyclus sp.]MBO6924022.1 carboxymuconolactone decarboxylase family protein [Roseicyclus sp.]
MSDTPQNPFEAMFAQTQQMAQEWVKTVNPAMANFTAQGFDKIWPTIPSEVLEAFWGKQFNPDGLDAKTRLLLTLQGLTIQGAVAEPQIRLTVRHAVEAGATKQEIAETIGQAAVFAGVPAMNKAMELAKAVIDEAEE